jgi:hypothetical protein
MAALPRISKAMSGSTGRPPSWALAEGFLERFEAPPNRLGVKTITPVGSNFFLAVHLAGVRRTRL